MTSEIVRPVVGTRETLARLREIHNSIWPANLGRFLPFSLRDLNGGRTSYIAVAWNPHCRTLYAQEITIGAAPPGCRMPQPMNVDEEDWESRVVAVLDPIRPSWMEKEESKIMSSAFNGLAHRQMLVDALLKVDRVGRGKDSDFVFNDFVFFDDTLRKDRIEQIAVELGKDPNSYRSYILKMVTRYLWYGGHEHSLLWSTRERGGPNKKRLAPANKPGTYSLEERLAKKKIESCGRHYKREERVDSVQLQNITTILKGNWSGGKKISLSACHRVFLDTYYPNCESDSVFLYSRFYYHSKVIIKNLDLLRERVGPTAYAREIAPRSGTSSELNQGVVEILDVDGWVPKMPIGALIDGELQEIDVPFVIGVSRNSTAVMGYEICLEGERAEGYLRCLVSAMLPKDDVVKALGLPPLPGLVYGNIDGVCTDNGPGRSKAVRGPTTGTMGGIMFTPPGRRPDLRGVGERLNKAIIDIIAEETDEGFNRGNDLVDREKRLKRPKIKPLTIDDAERIFLKAVSRVNTTANRHRLRTKEMREAKCGITPAEIHAYHQKFRRGAAARVRSEAEVFDIFIPWTPATCDDGIVVFKNTRYSSSELVAMSTEHAKLPGKKKALKVEIKRVSRLSTTLLCRSKTDRKVFEIEMDDEDRRRIGHNLTWKEHEFALFDERVHEGRLQAKRAHQTGRISVTRQEKLDAIERGRGNPYAGAVGHSKSQAKLSGAAKREAGLADRQARAYNLERAAASAAQGDNKTWTLEEQIESDPLLAAAQRAEAEYRETSHARSRRPVPASNTRKMPSD